MNVSTSSRLEVIDQYRGFATMMMVVANYAVSIKRIPRWLQHSPDVGLTVIDLGAPVFIYAIALTYGLSIQRRMDRHGWGKTAEHFLRRFMALFGIGALISYGQVLVGQSPTEVSWNVLQSIAVAGFLALPLIRLPGRYRAGIGLLLLLAYQILLEVWWLDEVLRSEHGGLLGTVGWTAMLVLGTVLADLFHSARRRRTAYLWIVLLVFLGGLALAFFIPVSKNRISASYVLISLASSGLLFWIFHLLVDHLNVRVPLFTAWGRNPLVLYLLHNLLLAIFVLPDIPAWYFQASPWLSLIQMMALLGVMSWFGWRLYRKGWRFSL